MSIRWSISSFFSRWQNRLRYLLRAPFVYKNWWAVLLPKMGVSVVLELRNGLRYLVRAGTTDLSVVNESSILDPYLGNGFDRLPEDGNVMDIGANIGDFTMQLARACPHGRVFAVEPMREHTRAIAVQVILNDANHVTILQVAVGSHEGEIDIQFAGNTSSVALGIGATEKVRVTTLGQIMDEMEIDQLALLKLDCEGAEWDILPAAEAVLPRVHRVYMEFHCERGWTPEKLADWFRERGYDVKHTAGPWNGLLWAIRTEVANRPQQSNERLYATA